MTLISISLNATSFWQNSILSAYLCTLLIGRACFFKADYGDHFGGYDDEFLFL